MWGTTLSCIQLLASIQAHHWNNTPHRVVEQVCKKTLPLCRNSHPTGTDSTQAAEILHGFYIQPLYTRKFGKLGWLALLHGLMRVCSKSMLGLISSLSLFSCPLSAYLKMHGSHSFLIYSTDYVHIFTDTFTEQDKIRAVFWLRTRPTEFSIQNWTVYPGRSSLKILQNQGKPHQHPEFLHYSNLSENLLA